FVYIKRVGIEGFYLLLGLFIVSIISLKSAFVRSDEVHIFQAIGPFLFLFLLMICLIEGKTLLRYTGYALLALVTVCSIYYGTLVSAHLKTPVLQVTNLAYQWHGLLDTEVDRRSIVPKEFEGMIDLRKNVLNFPYDNVIAIAMNRPSLAPIL